MKIWYLLANVVTVGAGILVYDQVRGGAAPTAPGTADDGTEIVRDAPPPSYEGPLLSGPLEDDVLKRLGGIERRLQGLEGRAPASVREAHPDGGSATGAERPTGEAAPVPGYEVPDVGDPKAPRFDPRQLAEFRVLMEEVEKQRQEERRSEAIRLQLQRLDLRLTPEQEQAVVKATLAFRDRIGESWRAARNETNDRASREQAYETLRAEYQEALEKVVPSADAQKIAEGIGRIPGVGRIRGDRNRPDGGPGDGPPGR